MTEEERQKDFSFRVTIANVLTFVAMVCGGFAFFMQMSEKVSSVKAEADELIKRIDAQRAQLNYLEAKNAAIERLHQEHDEQLRHIEAVLRGEVDDWSLKRRNSWMAPPTPPPAH